MNLQPPIDLTKVTSDPFSSLPYPILHTILTLLPPDSIIALHIASSHVLVDTQHNIWLWKRLLVRGMPWFWELHRALHDLTLSGNEEIDYRRLWLYLATHTCPRYGMRGPFIGVANRRRVWEACEGLVEPYWERLRAPLGKGVRGVGQEMFEGTYVDEGVFMSAVGAPLSSKGEGMDNKGGAGDRSQGPSQSAQPSDLIKCQFISSLDDIKTWSAIFIAGWHYDGSLAYFGVQFPGEEELPCLLRMSSSQNELFGEDRRQLYPGNWIVGLIVHISNHTFLYEPAITRLEVILESGARLQFPVVKIQYKKFQHNLKAYRRVLWRAEDSFIMGLQARFREGCPLSHLLILLSTFVLTPSLYTYQDGAFSHLGLIQKFLNLPSPNSSPLPPLQTPFSHRLLWHFSAINVIGLSHYPFLFNPSSPVQYQVLSHPKLEKQVLPQTDENGEEIFPSVAYQLLYWLGGPKVSHPMQLNRLSAVTMTRHGDGDGDGGTFLYALGARLKRHPFRDPYFRPYKNRRERDPYSDLDQSEEEEETEEDGDKRDFLRYNYVTPNRFLTKERPSTWQAEWENEKRYVKQEWFFDIDGLGGERVVEVAIPVCDVDANEEERIRALKIRTNFNREVIFGTPPTTTTTIWSWSSCSPPPGHCILGIAAGFEVESRLEKASPMLSIMIMTAKEPEEVERFSHI